MLKLKTGMIIRKAETDFVKVKKKTFRQETLSVKSE